MAHFTDHALLQAKILNAASPALRLELTFKPMFGGVMIYAATHPFASLAEPGLSIKLGAEDRTHLLKEPGTAMLQHDGAPPSKQYVTIPKHLLENEAQLRIWLDRSATFARHTARLKGTTGIKRGSP